MDGPSELVELFPGPIRLLQRPISCPYGPQNRPGQAVRPSAAFGRVEGLKGLKIKPQGLFGVSDSFRTNVQVQGVHVRDDDLGGTWKDNGPPKSPAGGRAGETGERGVPLGRNGMVGRCASEIVHPNIIISKYNQDIVSPMHTPHLRIQL